MLRIEYRQKFQTNGLIDDFVVYGIPSDYLHFSGLVKAAIASPAAVVLNAGAPIRIEISLDEDVKYLFTALQNQDDDYISMEDWNSRSILRVVGSEAVLKELSDFLVDLSGRGVGYSYISEFSETYKYADFSPEWRMHVESPYDNLVPDKNLPLQ